MNLIIMVGKLTKDFEDKNGVMVGTIADGKSYYDLVAFGFKTDLVKDFKKGQLVIVQGELRKNKYNDRYYYKIAISEIALFQYQQTSGSEILDNSEIIEDNPPLNVPIPDIQEGNTDGLDIPDDDLPF